MHGNSEEDRHVETTHILRVVVLPHGEGLPLPAYETEGAVGVDLRAAIPEGEEMQLAPLARAAVPTGLIVAVPEGFEGQVRARSGRALRDGLALVNGVGTIDPDYRGELAVAVINLSNWPIRIRRGERIAQFVIAPIFKAPIVAVASLENTTRGTGGFGSTGK